jgi:hypothetical protein
MEVNKMAEPILNVGEDAAVEPAFVAKATDPVILPQPYVSPSDFHEQYPTPLDTTELLALCEELSVWKSIPEVRTGLQIYTWREMDFLYMTSGSTSNIDKYIAFADGDCPEEFDHGGDNWSVYLMNIGAKKTLSLSDIMHSQAIAGAGGIGTLLGGFPGSEGSPGGSDLGSFQREVVRNVKEKEVRLASTLVMNAWDRLLVNGDTTTNSLEFDGIEFWDTRASCTFHTNTNAASGTFDGTAFDRFLSEGCARPTHLLGHPAAMQEVMSAYFQLGFQGSQIIGFNGPANRITPGFNFASQVNTGIGTLTVIADTNFRRTLSAAGMFQADIWALRMVHNGEPLVYKITQIPLVYKDLVPGCTAISFEIWAKTALVIKMCCAQGKYTSQFTGRIVSTCAVLD